MKKILYSVLSFILVLSIVGCQKDKSKEIVVAASKTPHSDILYFAKDILKEQGYDLKIKVYNDYIMPNQALTLNQVDANFFQHEPYLNTYNEENNTNILSVAKIHIEPIGIYSKVYDSLDDIKDGATVAISSSKSDYGRLLNLLVKAGLITLNDDVNPYQATLDDIKENPKNLSFRDDIDPTSLVDAYKYNQADLILINSNFVLDAGLNPGVDAIALESPTDNPFANIIATLPENVQNEKILALVDVLLSEAVRNFILDKWGGDVVPNN